MKRFILTYSSCLLMACLFAFSVHSCKPKADVPPNPMQDALDALTKAEMALVKQLDGVWIPDSFAVKGVEDADNLAFNIDAMIFRKDLSYEVVASEGFKNEQGHWLIALPDSLYMREKDAPIIDNSSYRISAVDEKQLVLVMADATGFELSMYLDKMSIND